MSVRTEALLYLLAIVLVLGLIFVASLIGSPPPTERGRPASPTPTPLRLVSPTRSDGRGGAKPAPATD